MEQPRQFDTLPDINKRLIMDAGFDFLQAMIDGYGEDAGLALWQSITDKVDPNISRSMLLALLTGESRLGRVIIIKDCDPNRYVEAIKAIRQVTGLGLKEAKDLCDHVRAGRHQKVQLGASGDMNLRDASKILKAAGCVIT